MGDKEKYIRPEIEIIEVCSEGVIMEPSRWESGGGDGGPVIEGNPPTNAKEYPEGSHSLWEDDEY